MFHSFAIGRSSGAIKATDIRSLQRAQIRETLKFATFNYRSIDLGVLRVHRLEFFDHHDGRQTAARLEEADATQTNFAIDSFHVSVGT